MRSCWKKDAREFFLALAASVAVHTDPSQLGNLLSMTAAQVGVRWALHCWSEATGDVSRIPYRSYSLILRPTPRRPLGVRPKDNTLGLIRPGEKAPDEGPWFSHLQTNHHETYDFAILGTL